MIRKRSSLSDIVQDFGSTRRYRGRYSKPSQRSPSVATLKRVKPHLKHGIDVCERVVSDHLLAPRCQVCQPLRKENAPSGARLRSASVSTPARIASRILGFAVICR